MPSFLDRARRFLGMKESIDYHRILSEYMKRDSNMNLVDVQVRNEIDRIVLERKLIQIEKGSTSVEMYKRKMILLVIMNLHLKAGIEESESLAKRKEDVEREYSEYTKNNANYRTLFREDSLNSIMMMITDQWYTEMAGKYPVPIQDKQTVKSKGGEYGNSVTSEQYHSSKEGPTWVFETDQDGGVVYKIIETTVVYSNEIMFGIQTGLALASAASQGGAAAAWRAGYSLTLMHTTSSIIGLTISKTHHRLPMSFKDGLVTYGGIAGSIDNVLDSGRDMVVITDPRNNIFSRMESLLRITRAFIISPLTIKAIGLKVVYTHGDLYTQERVMQNQMMRLIMDTWSIANIGSQTKFIVQGGFDRFAQLVLSRYGTMKLDDPRLQSEETRLWLTKSDLDFMPDVDPRAPEIVRLLSSEGVKSYATQTLTGIASFQIVEGMGDIASTATRVKRAGDAQYFNRLISSGVIDSADAEEEAVQNNNKRKVVEQEGEVNNVEVNNVEVNVKLPAQTNPSVLSNEEIKESMLSASSTIRNAVPEQMFPSDMTTNNLMTRRNTMLDFDTWMMKAAIMSVEQGDNRKIALGIRDRLYLLRGLERWTSSTIVEFLELRRRSIELSANKISRLQIQTQSAFEKILRENMPNTVQLNNLMTNYAIIVRADQIVSAAADALNDADRTTFVSPLRMRYSNLSDSEFEDFLEKMLRGDADEELNNLEYPRQAMREEHSRKRSRQPEEKEDDREEPPHRKRTYEPPPESDRLPPKQTQYVENFVNRIRALSEYDRAKSIHDDLIAKINKNYELVDKLLLNTFKGVRESVRTARADYHVRAVNAQRVFVDTLGGGARAISDYVIEDVHRRMREDQIVDTPPEWFDPYLNHNMEVFRTSSIWAIEKAQNAIYTFNTLVNNGLSADISDRVFTGILPDDINYIMTGVIEGIENIPDRAKSIAKSVGYAFTNLQDNIESANAMYEHVIKPSIKAVAHEVGTRIGMDIDPDSMRKQQRIDAAVREGVRLRMEQELNKFKNHQGEVLESEKKRAMETVQIELEKQRQIGIESIKDSIVDFSLKMAKSAEMIMREEAVAQRLSDYERASIQKYRLNYEDDVLKQKYREYTTERERLVSLFDNIKKRTSVLELIAHGPRVVEGNSIRTQIILEEMENELIDPVSALNKHAEELENLLLVEEYKSDMKNTKEVENILLVEEYKYKKEHDDILAGIIADDIIMEIADEIHPEPDNIEILEVAAEPERIIHPELRERLLERPEQQVERAEQQVQQPEQQVDDFVDEVQPDIFDDPIPDPIEQNFVEQDTYTNWLWKYFIPKFSPSPTPSQTEPPTEAPDDIPEDEPVKVKPKADDPIPFLAGVPFVDTLEERIDREKQKIMSLRPFLAIYAGTSEFEEQDNTASTNMKQNNLLIGQIPFDPLGLADNAIALSNIVQEGILYMGELETLQTYYKGSTLTEGDTLYGTHRVDLPVPLPSKLCLPNYN